MEDLKETKSLSTMVFEMKSLAQILVEKGGEITQELENKINSLTLETAEKVDQTVWVIKNFEDAEKRLKEEKIAFDKAMKIASNAIDSIKFRIKDIMKTSELTEIEGKTKSFKLSNSKPSLIIDETKLNDDYFIEVVSHVPNKDKIKADLELGITVDGAYLQDTKSLRITIKKGDK